MNRSAVDHHAALLERDEISLGWADVVKHFSLCISMMLLCLVAFTH